MNDIRYGATPSEWQFWAHTLGLQRELLPTVCNPTATISPSSVLTSFSKVPCRYTTTGFVVGMPKWNEYQTDDGQLAEWSSVPDYGICLQMRTIQAFDVDVNDAGVVAQITDTLGLYEMPRRWRSNSAKCLFLFHPQTPSKKRVLKVGDGMIEMLGLGNQCLVAGQHPSGVRYEWDPFSSIPRLDDDTISAILEDLRSNFGGDKKWSRGAAVPKHIHVPVVKKVKAATTIVTDATTTVTDAAWSGTTTDAPRYQDVDPVVDYLTEKGCVKGESAEGFLYVECPFQADHGKQQADATQTVYFPAGSGDYVRGHVNCLDGACGDKTDRDFMDAWGWTRFDGLRGFEAIPFTPEELAAQRDREVQREIQREVLASLGVEAQAGTAPTVHPLEAPLYDRDTKTGVIRVHQNNLTLFCRHPLECGYVFVRDTFKQEVYCTKVEPGAVATKLADEITTDLVMRARDQGFGPVTVPRDQVLYAILYVATPYDSAIQWLRALPAWDGTPRVASFCHRYLGCEDTPYYTSVSLYWWTALAGRVLTITGIQADMTPILIGSQGSGKSSTARTMVPYPEWYASLSFHTSKKELALQMFGKVIGELAELSGLKGKDMESTKEWLTTIKDSARIVYERFPRDYGRRLVFVGTTNRDDFATDPTGNRRLLPVWVGKAQDIAAIIRDRDQLWAEAAVLFDAGGIQWKAADRLGRDHHGDIMAPMPMEIRIAAWLNTTQTVLVTKEGIEGLTWGELPYLSVIDVGVGALQATAVQAAQGSLSHQLGDVLRKFGYSGTQIRVDGRRIHVWVREGIDGSAGIAEWKRIHAARGVK